MKVPKLLMRKLDVSLPTGVEYGHLTRRESPVHYLQKLVRIPARVMAYGGPVLEDKKRFMKEEALACLSRALLDSEFIGTEEWQDPVTHDHIIRYYVPVLKPEGCP